MSNVVTRFPPSPTGYFHIGSARTALFNYLYAAKHNGTMYLRFEDTDKERSKKEYEDDILQGLQWLGISYTPAAPLRQSEKTDEYKTYLKQLIDTDAAYEAEESESGGKVVRFRNPNVRISFSDLIRGEVGFDTTELKDFVIARNVEAPLYHLTVVADDHDQQVTHVIRGEDHISNTQRQILILEALGFERPHYAHMPLILASDKSKLSKRHGAVSVNEYRAQGYLPEALVNYLALLGWNPGGDKELFSLRELVDSFSIERVHKGGAVFDIEKLQWLNHEYVKQLDDRAFGAEVAKRAPEWSDAVVQRILPVVRERVRVWSDLEALKGELDFFFLAPSVDAKKLPGKGNDTAATTRHLGEVRKLLDTLPSSGEMTADDVKKAVWDYAEREGRGAVLWPLRYALTGKERSPDPFTVASVLGRDESISRIDAALEALSRSA